MVTNIDNYYWKKLGEISPLHFGSSLRLPVMQLPVTSGYITSGDATSGDDPPQIQPGWCIYTVFPAFFLTETSLDSMLGQSNCESNMYRVNIALLPPLAMLTHFFNP
jgi:hypothetical protein